MHPLHHRWEDPIPEWDSISTPSARRLRGLIIDELKQHTKQIVFVDDCWIGVRVEHPEFDQPNDQGYHFGYVVAAHNPQLSLERSEMLTSRLESLMHKICDMAYAIDYPWAELYGHSRPPCLQ